MARHPTCPHGYERADGDFNPEPARATVLDPFCGAGTTGVVALRHDRDFVGIELNAGLCRDGAQPDTGLTHRSSTSAQSMNLGNPAENRTARILEGFGYLVASRRHVGGAGDLVALPLQGRGPDRRGQARAR